MPGRYIPKKEVVVLKQLFKMLSISVESHAEDPQPPCNTDDSTPLRCPVIPLAKAKRVTGEPVYSPDPQFWLISNGNTDDAGGLHQMFPRTTGSMGWRKSHLSLPLLRSLDSAAEP